MRNPYRMFFYRTWLWLRRSFSYVWLMLAAVYLVGSAGRAVFHNYQSQQATKELRDELMRAEKDRDRLQALLVYYMTDNFKEKELRRALLLKMPGEAVYALPESNAAVSIEEDILTNIKQGETKQSIEHPKPNWQLWLDYLIYRKNLK